LFYQINDKQRIFTEINTIKSNNLLVENNAQFVEDYNSTFYNIRYEFLKKQYNNFLFPINFAFDIKTGFGFRKVEGIKEDQKIFSLNTYKIFNLNNRNSIYFRIKSEGIISDSYLVNELFRFGGINTIRGFEENSILASFMVYLIVSTDTILVLPFIYIQSLMLLILIMNSLIQ